MKKTVSLGMLALLSTQILGGTVLATDNGKELKTDGELELIVPSDLKPEVKPPEEPEDGNEGEIVDKPGGSTPEGNVGPLYINFAPNFDFGVWGVGEKTEYFAKPQMWKDAKSGETRQRANFVQVTDLRGKSEGWGLSVKQEGAFQSASQKTLGATEISFLNTAIGSDMLKDDEGKKQLPDTVVNSTSVLKPDGTVELMKAPNGKGAGTWSMNFEETLGQPMEKMENENDIPKDEDGKPVRTPNALAGAVKLTIPATSNKFAEAYKTTLTWSLTDKPGDAIL